jgi:hypothetical protein
MFFMKRKKTKKISYDLSKEELSEKVKSVILEQTKIIESLNSENEELRKENADLKKTSSKSFRAFKSFRHKAIFYKTRDTRQS